MRKIIVVLLAVSSILVLCACGPTLNSTTTNQGASTQQMAAVLNEVTRSNLEPIEIDHGEDYVIEWVDPGMEAHIRFLLDKPEGDIRHSDIWDIQVLTIQPANGTPHDVALNAPVNGFNTFDFESIFYLTYRNNWKEYNGKSFPGIVSLQDLRHFDSLQIFYADLLPRDGILTDISGIEECKHLKELTIINAQLDTLAPVAQVMSLQDLDLLNCGTLDLTPLENLPFLSEVSLRGCNILSLEPLTTLPALEYVSVGLEATYPSLEPLSRTTVEYLSMSLSLDGIDMYADLDYAPLVQIPNLVFLDLTNHTRVDYAFCDTLLSQNSKIKYLDISYTSAANQLSELIPKYPNVQICCSGTRK